MVTVAPAIIDQKRCIAPVVRILVRGKGQRLRADVAGGIGGLDQAHCVGDGARAAGANEDQGRSAVAVVIGGTDSVLGRH